MSHVKYKKKSRKKNLQPRWPLLLVIGGGLLLVFAVVTRFARPPQAAQTKAPIEVSGAPSLKVDRETVNLGDIKLGRTIDVSFQLTNVGDKPLRFSKAPYIEVKEGC